MLVRPIVMYACGDWASTKLDKKKIVFDMKILPRVYGPKRNEEKNTYERRTNSELKAIFNEQNIVEILKSR